MACLAAGLGRVLCSRAVDSMASSSDPPKQYGITKPLSLLGPVEADLQRTAELEKVRNCFSFMSGVSSQFLCIVVSHSLFQIEITLPENVISGVYFNSSSW